MATLANCADWIAIPVHNRRTLTVDCLRALAHDGVSSWARVCVIDDGSTDGTSEQIAREFADIERIAGDGTWWWCGAIRRGMEHALARGAERIFWLNDDCRPPPGGLHALREFVRQNQCVSWIAANSPDGWTYGAHRKTAWRIRPCTAAEEARGEVDTFSGNCVCLPRPWIERVGLPHDHLFPHGIGDLDYGLRLKAAGAPLRALPGFAAKNANPSRSSSESWLASSRPMRQIWRDFHSPRSFLHFPAWRRFALRHWGPVLGWLVFALPYLRWILIALLRKCAPRLARSLAARRTVNSPTAPARSAG